MQNDDLDGLLAFAAKHPAVPLPGLLDRVVADALALQPLPLTIAPPGAVKPARIGFLSRLTDFFGGPVPVAGVTSAALLGLMLGYLDPATMDILAPGQATDQAEAETMDLFPSVDFLTTEG